MCSSDGPPLFQDLMKSTLFVQTNFELHQIVTDLESRTGEKVIEYKGEQVAVVAFKTTIKPEFSFDEHGKSGGS